MPRATGNMTMVRMVISILAAGTSIAVSAINKVMAGVSSTARMVEILVRLIDKHDHHLHAQIGLSFPSGSLTEQDKTPASGGTTVRLPYPMQIGSGTYDFLPGLTYTGSRSAYSWGAQARGEIRMNENHAEAAGVAAVLSARPMPHNGYMVQIAKTLVKRAILACK